MAFHSAKGDLGHDHAKRMRQAKYSAAVKSSKSWYEKQIAIHDEYEKEIIANMTDKEFSRYIRSQLNKVFKKR